MGLGNGMGYDAGGSGGGGGGTVTSVGLTVTNPAIFTVPVPGSPVTTFGTLSLDLVPQTNNKVFAGPTTAGSGKPTFRSLVAADIPALPYGTGTVTSVGLISTPMFVTGLPITTSGNLSFAFNTVTDRRFLGGPSGSGTAAPTFRFLEPQDIPTLDYWSLNGNTGTNPSVNFIGDTGANVRVVGLDISLETTSVVLAQFLNSTGSAKIGGSTTLAGSTQSFIFGANSNINGNFSIVVGTSSNVQGVASQIVGRGSSVASSNFSGVWGSFGAVGFDNSFLYTCGNGCNADGPQEHKFVSSNGVRFNSANATQTFQITGNRLIAYTTPVYANNAAALLGGESVGTFYRDAVGLLYQVF